MTKLKKFNLAGEEIGQVAVNQELAQAEASGQMVKDYIVALRHNARSWTASTKTRSEVAHTTKKPHPQKKTGNARQGSLVSPQFRGGGRVGTPRPKFDQYVRINRKERQAVIRALLGEKIREQRLCVLESMEMGKPKTQAISSFLSAVALGKRVLFLGDAAAATFQLSLRNLPKVEFREAANVSGYDLILANDVVVTEAALAQLLERLV